MQRLRSNESPDKRKAMLAVERERSAQGKAAESPEETAARLAMKRKRSAQARAAIFQLCAVC